MLRSIPPPFTQLSQGNQPRNLTRETGELLAKVARRDNAALASEEAGPCSLDACGKEDQLWKKDQC